MLWVEKTTTWKFFDWPDLSKQKFNNAGEEQSLRLSCCRRTRPAAQSQLIKSYSSERLLSVAHTHSLRLGSFSRAACFLASLYKNEGMGKRGNGNFISFTFLSRKLFARLKLTSADFLGKKRQLSSRLLSSLSFNLWKALSSKWIWNCKWKIILFISY